MNQFNESILNEYLDGTLDESTHQQVEQWLAESEAARNMLADLQLAFSALSNLDDVPLTNDLASLIMAEIEGVETAVFPTWVRWLASIQLVAAVGLVVAYWPSWQQQFSASREIIYSLIININWPQIAIGEQIMDWGTAVWQQLQFNPPILNLATSQWSLLLVLAFLAWLAGARLLFSEESRWN